ncbi:MAG TPA: hypothetical protein VHT02_09810 [Methylocella sp.]|nr:hypothetical protein [Methylocella sp.]
MTRIRILLATVFGAALVASGPASAAEVNCWYNGGLHRCVWYPGYTYEYGYPYGYGLGPIGDIATAPLALAGDTTAPLVTGRSVAVEKVPLMTGRSAADETVAVTGLGPIGNIATAPLALGAAATEPLMTGRSAAVETTVVVTGVAGAGNYCATSVKTCLLNEPGWLGTGCSCRVAGGRARGFVQ